MCLSVSLSHCPTVSLLICLSVCLVSLPLLFVFVNMCVFLSVCLSVSVCLPGRPVYLSVVMSSVVLV